MKEVIVMVIIIHYQENDEPRNYTISANSKREFEICLKRFKEQKGLKDEQFSMEVISSNTF